MKRAWGLLVPLAFGAAGCNTSLRADPNGLRCDVGDVCPPSFQCVAGICRSAGNACTPTSCSTPPSSQCQDANTKRVFTSGSCDQATGQCVWTTQDTTCASGCAAGACVGQNLCQGVTCTTPPAPSCSGNNRLTYASTGTCNTGTGQCSYAQTSTPCPAGCSAGQCIATALTFLQRHPWVRHRVDAVDQAPSSNGDRVLAVGPSGAVSYFNGTAWAPVSGGGSNDLTAVWFSGANTAWIAGKNRTVLRWNGSSLTTVTGVPGSSAANFVSVHGTSDSNVVLADENGAWWRFGAPNWTTGQLSSAANQPYAMRSAWVDSAGRTRIAGRCGAGTPTAKGCVFYNNPDAGTTWYEDLDNSASTTDGFMAVGPTPNPVSSTNEAWVGQFPTSALKRHNGNTGNYDGVGVPTVPAGGGVLGITGTGPGAVSRATFLLSAGTGTEPARLYRATATGLDPPTALFEFFHNARTLSRTESGGVLVADARTSVTPVVNDIIRRGALTNEALDIAEDWVGFDTGVLTVPGGSTVQAWVMLSPFNDVAVRAATGGAKWTYRRGPFTVGKEMNDVAAGNGYAVLAGRQGTLYRFSSAGFSAISGSGSSDLNAACRASDTEHYVVGAGGVILSYGGLASASAMTSPTAKNLFDVDCPVAGTAVACGQDGTVLQLRTGAWSAVSPAFPVATAQLTSCKLLGGALYVAGDGVFYRFQSGAWTALASRPSLTDLVVRAGNDIYAASGAEIARFDGTSWTGVFTAPQVLRAGGQVGARVVYAGGSGVVVEGQ